MSSVIINRFSESAIQLLKVNELNSRIQSKFYMFLNSTFSSDNIIIGKDEVIINFVTTDIYLNGENIKRIIGFLSNLDITCFCDDEIKILINKYEENFKEIKSTENLVYDIKTSNFQKEQKFVDFKAFCDKNLQIKLRDYQYEAAYLITTSKSAFDFSVPGSGKTIITYSAYRYFKQKDNIDKILVIGPKNSYHAWYDEYITCFGELPDFEDLSTNNLDYTKSYFSASKQNHKEISFINIEKIRNIKKEIIKFLSNSKVLLVVDECHKVKNPEAQSTKVVLELAKHSNHKILLTGTPMPNGYEDLYTLTNILSPYNKILPYNYSQLKQFTKSSINPEQETTIMDSLFPYYSRVSKKFLIERKELLNPIINIGPYVKMDFEQQEVYNFLNDLSYNINNDWELEFSFIMKKAIMIRKMQASANPKLLNKSLLSVYENEKKELFNFDEEDEVDSDYINIQLEKLKIAGERIDKEISESSVGKLIKDFNRGKYIISKNQKAVDLVNDLILLNKKVVLWDVFVDNMMELKNMIIKQLNISVEVINGNVVGDNRKKVIDDFREGDLMVLIASPATLAESISLHKICQNAIYVNRNYNAAQFIQSKDRIHRIGMPDNTTASYNFLININTIDEAVHDRLDKKEQRMLKILDNDNLIIGDLNSNTDTTISTEDVEESYLK